MYELFEKHFSKDLGTSKSLQVLSSGMNCEPMLLDLFSRHGGASFNERLYRVISFENVESWNVLVTDAFTKFRGKIFCFGCDWLGRIFAVNEDRSARGFRNVLMFEPGTGQVLEIPCDILAFHNKELVEYREEALAYSFYSKWLANGGPVPRMNQCVAYKIPLFLGGKDLIENLELSDSKCLLDNRWAVDQ